MPLATDNKTLQLLRTFARRRRRLILLRGVAATTLALVIGMVAVALCDRLFIMDLPARLALSLAAYLVAVVVAWRVAGRHLVRRDRPGSLARMIEAAEPALRDRLLAAVELGEHANGAAAFREIVREDAARRASEVRVERTLPWRLISWWVGAGAGALLLCVALLTVPGLQFGRMLGRALVPTAEIPRASKYSVAFNGGDAPRVVPAGESSTFEVVVRGGKPREVSLWLDPQDGERRIVPMEPAGAVGEILLYRAAVTLDGPATLRAWADDADSHRLPVGVRPRPSVVSFTKRYLPPSYLAHFLPASDPVTESTGALEALQESLAEIELTADQPIRTGRIELLGNDGEPLAGTAPIELQPVESADGTRLRASLPIQFDGAYRVQLVAAETGFETRHAPLWPVTARPDLPPSVQAQVVDGRPVAADALLGLQATVDDDIGLAWARRDIRLNGGEWLSGDLLQPDTGPRRIDWSTPLDLLPMSLMPGDRIEARLVVSDLKGAETVGSFGEWIVVTDGLGDVRLQALAAKQEVALAAVRLADETAALSQETDEAIDRLKRLREQGAGDSIEVEQLWLSLAARARAVESAAEDVLRGATGALATVPGGRDARDLERLGEAASHIRRRAMAEFLAVIDAAGTGAATPDDRLAAARDTASAAARLGGMAAALGEAVVRSEQASLAAQEVGMLVDESMTQLAQLQSQLDRDGERDVALGWQQFARGAATLAARLQGARERLDESRLALASDPEALGELDAIRTQMDRAAERLRRALRAEAGEALVEPVVRVRQVLLGLLPHLGQVAIQLEEQLEGSRRRLNAPRTADTLEALAEQFDEPHRKIALDRLGDRAALQERRADLDRAFLHDLTLARQAVRAMQAAEQSGGPSDALKERARDVARAMVVLEAGHDVTELLLRVEGMEQSEKLEAERPTLDRWRDWIALLADARRAGDVLRAAGLDRDAARRIDRLPESRAAAGFQQALEHTGAPEEAAASLQALADEIRTAATLLEPAMAEARALLAEEALPLPAWMEELAGEAQALSERTRSTDDPDQARQEQEALDARIRELEEAIRRDAAQQDLLSEEGRQRVRDADDAAAMLREDRNRTTERLSEARAAQEEERRPLLDRVAESQQAASDTLRELAEHFRNLESAPEAAAESRQALRDRESELGLKERLDAEYERMERLAEMQELGDREMLEALERELPRDEAMQRELGRLADDAARQGRSGLDAAARRERATESDLARAASEQERAKRASEEEAKALAETLRELAREEIPDLRERLERDEPGPEQEQLEGAAEALREGARAAERSALDETRRSLEQAREAVEAVRQAQGEKWQEAARETQEALERYNRAKESGSPEEVAVAELQRAAAAERTREARQSERQALQTQRKLQDAMRQAQRAQEGNTQQIGEESLEQAREAQDQVAGDAEQAADALERAARHEERLGNQQKSQAMQQAAQGARQAVQEEVAGARQATQEAQQPAQASPAVAEAREALERQASAAEQAGAMPDEQPSPASADRTGSMMAQALDQLDRMLNGERGQAGQPGQPQGQQAQGGQQQGQQQGQPGQQGQDGSGLARAMAQRAADAQARTMRNRRLPAMPGQPSDGAGQGADLAGMPEGELNALRPPNDGGDWGRLPPEVVRDLLHGRQDAAPAEYRDLVEAYYRAIAERARRRE